MKAEVFIPTFNRSEKLRRAIESVLNQTCGEVGVCVLDNHSTDGTQAMIERLLQHDERIRYVRHDSNIGMVPNFNRIHALVSTEFFAVLTDDDEYESSFIATAMAAFERHPNIGLVACNAPTRIGNVVVKSQLDHWREGFYRANNENIRCILGHYPLITNCLFRREVAADFRFHPELGNVGDGLLLTCLFAKYDSYVSKVITGYWNNDGGNASSLQKFDAVRHVNISVYELRFYREFCVRNEIAMRGLFLLRLKLWLIVLFAAGRAGFAEVETQSLLRQTCKPFAIDILRVLSATRVISLVIRTLAGARRLGVRWVAWRERNSSARS